MIILSENVPLWKFPQIVNIRNRDLGDRVWTHMKKQLQMH